MVDKMIQDFNMADQLDYNWLVDMHELNHEMIINPLPNFERYHIVYYGAGAFKLVSHNAWLQFKKHGKMHVFPR
jgi:hypothetical protein